MNRQFGTVPTFSPPVRVACITAAAVCAFAIDVGLFDLFDHASSERWLRPTPQLLSAKAECDALPGRSERMHCTQALVARTLAALDQPEQALQLAAR